MAGVGSGRIAAPRPGEAEGAADEAARLLIPAATAIHRAVAASRLGGREGAPLRQIQALLILTESGPLPVGTLARRLGVAPSTATALTDRLLAGGLIERRPGEDDRRRCLAAATRRGRDEARRYRRLTAAALRRRMEGLSAAQRSELAKAFAVILRVLGTPADSADGRGRPGE